MSHLISPFRKPSVQWGGGGEVGGGGGRVGRAKIFDKFKKAIQITYNLEIIGNNKQKIIFSLIFLFIFSCLCRVHGQPCRPTPPIISCGKLYVLHFTSLGSNQGLFFASASQFSVLTKLKCENAQYKKV